MLPSLFPAARVQLDVGAAAGDDGGWLSDTMMLAYDSHELYFSLIDTTQLSLIQL